MVAVTSTGRETPSLSIRPETAGYATSAVGAPSLLIHFDTWLRDDIVRAHPHVLVTTRLKKALQALKGARGFSIVGVQVTKSPFFLRHSPGRKLPKFWRVVVEGRPGIDDMGLSVDSKLVVSLRTVSVLMRFNIRNAELAQYCRPIARRTRRPKR